MNSSRCFPAQFVWRCSLSLVPLGVVTVFAKAVCDLPYIWGCPICRHWISYEDSCSLDIVLWNTIRRLFPEEVEARKAIQHSFPREVEAWKAIDVLNRPRNLSEQSRRDLSRDLKCMLCGLFVGVLVSFFVLDSLID